MESGGGESLEEKKGECKQTHDEIATTFESLVDEPIKIMPRISKISEFNFPLYHRPDFQQLPKAEQSDILAKYYTKLSASRIQYAKQSFVHASFSEPIYPVTRQDRASRSPSPEKNQTGLETKHRVYTSRAGRQVKRKNYTEDFDMDSETEFVSQVVKKTKAPSSSNKLSNPHSNLSSSMKLTIGTAYEEEDFTKNGTARSNSALPKKILAAEDDIQTNEEDYKDEPKTKASSVQKNTSILKKTFSSPTNRLTRSEQMFENLKRNNARKELEEEKLTKFENSLQSINDEDVVIDSSPPIILEDFVKKRVQPPSGIPRKQRARKKPNFQPLSMASTSTSAATTSSSTIRTNPDQKRKTGESKTPTEICPICSGKFLLPEIEEHAAQCGLVDENEGAVAPSMRLCPNCQAVLDFADFEAHEMNCLAVELANM